MRVVYAREPGFFGIQSGYSPALQKIARSIPGITWDKNQSLWKGRQDAVDTVAAHLSNAGIRVDSLEARSEPGFSGPLPATLRDYQRAGVEFILAEKECILADDMGLGKTFQTLAAAIASGSSRILIVCPHRARNVWKAELIKRFGREPTLLNSRTGDAAKLPENGFVICHYEIVFAWKAPLEKWSPQFVAFDEAQNLSNEKTQRTIGARVASADATYRVALTGTPIPNRISDLYPIVETVRPGTFAGNGSVPFFPFGLRYCNGHQEEHPSREVQGANEKHWDFSGSSRLDELKQRLAYFMLRRTKTDVQAQLPPKVRQSVFLDVPNAGMMPGSALNRSETRRLLDIAGTAKIKPVIEAAADAARDGANVVVFTHRKATADTIAAGITAAGVRAITYHGDIASGEREKRLAAFQQLCQPIVPFAVGTVFVATIDSAGDAISLAGASVCIFAELSYEPYKLLQAEDRLHRHGALSTVFIQYFLARGSVDELIARNVIEKLDVIGSAGLTPNGAALQESLQENETDLMSRLYANMADWTPDDIGASLTNST